MKEHEEEGEKREEEKDIVDFLLEVYRHEVYQNPYQGFLAGKFTKERKKNLKGYKNRVKFGISFLFASSNSLC